MESFVSGGTDSTGPFHPLVATDIRHKRDNYKDLWNTVEGTETGIHNARVAQGDTTAANRPFTTRTHTGRIFDGKHDELFLRTHPNYRGRQTDWATNRRFEMAGRYEVALRQSGEQALLTRQLKYALDHWNDNQ